MREKELRIALVCFGGVSLAIYMHGISKEILKLVRGSAALHGDHRPQQARPRQLSSTASTSTTANTIPKPSTSSCCARSGARSSCASSSTLSPAPPRAASTAPCWRVRSVTICRWTRCASSGSKTPTSPVLLAPRGARRRVEQVFSAAVHLGRDEVRHAAARTRRRSARNCRCSCARAGSSRR